MKEALYPLSLTPTLHVKVWGGRKLETELGKTLFGDSPYGESWELHDQCTIGNGAFAGRELSDLIEEYGTAIVGESFDPAEGLPLLVKFLDATEWLSVQVHPNDTQARELEGDPRGKTEAWIILAADAGARLVIGVQPGTSREALARAIAEGTLEDLLVYRQVTSGDVLYMPANTVHAIGPGNLIYEVQQSSNVTYRLYDWGRMGLDGKPRELHIEKGTQVANVDSVPQITHPDGELVVEGDYFQTMRLQLDNDEQTRSTNGFFHGVTCTAGVIMISQGATTMDIPQGQTVLIPAALPEYTIRGTGTLLISYMKA